MYPIKLHKWYFTIAFASLLAIGCSHKNVAQKTITEKEEIEMPANYSPPGVITVSKEKTKTNDEGELYYDNEYGYRYWKNNDGQFYLDVKYERDGVKPKKSRN